MHESGLLLAAFLLLAALVTGLARKFGRWLISIPMIFVFAGIFLGPHVSGMFYMRSSTDSVQLLAELTLAMVLFAEASTLNLRQVSADTSLPGRLLLIGLPLTIALGGLVARLLYPGLSLGYGLLIAAILAPTDASLGLPIYSNPRMPVRIRRALNIESGLNDGIVSPFVVLFVSMSLRAEGLMLSSWLNDALLELGLAILFGVIIGFIGGTFLQTAVSSRWTSEMYSKLSILAVALACYFLSLAMGGNGFVAAFVGGLIFGHASKHELEEQTEFVEAGGTLLALLVWTVFAAIFISPELKFLVTDFDGRAVLYAVFSLTLVRMVPVAISMIGSGLRSDTILLMGWFGPRGLASVVFGLLAVSSFHQAGMERFQPMSIVVTLTVLFSVFAHGLSARPLVKWYAGRLDRAEIQHVELEEMPELSFSPRMGRIQHQD